VIVHDHLETPSAITLKPASTIASMGTRLSSPFDQRIDDRDFMVGTFVLLSG
jgi:hypothetical protein